jgi:hypothetical protein
MRTWKGHAGDTVGFIGEKIVTAAIKVRYSFACF